MPDNGSNEGVAHLPSDSFHEEFDRLCALSVSGELDAEEWRGLESHLRGCAQCRASIKEYARVASTVVPRMAPFDEPSDESYQPWSMDDAEAALMDRIERENIVPEAKARGRVNRLPWIVLPIAATLLTLIAYEAGVRRSKGLLAKASAMQTPGASHTALAAEQPRHVATSDSLLDNRSLLVKELADGETNILRLTEERDRLTASLEAGQASTAAAAENLKQANEQIATLGADNTTLRGELEQSRSQGSSDQADLRASLKELSALNATVKAKDQQISEDRELLEHDRDIRNLMGARDLYIGDVYDVAQTGATQKPFGRVFYTKGKSLVFYAYDLDQHPGIKAASTFQAWGRRLGDQSHDVNLGMFFQDDQSKKRWVLKSNDPSTLSQLDAVFVTVEPHAESNKPTGKPILFTYLKLNSNHP